MKKTISNLKDHGFSVDIKNGEIFVSSKGRTFIVQKTEWLDACSGYDQLTDSERGKISFETYFFASTGPFYGLSEKGKIWKI